MPRTRNKLRLASTLASLPFLVTAVALSVSSLLGAGGAAQLNMWAAISCIVGIAIVALGFAMSRHGLKDSGRTAEDDVRNRNRRGQ